MSVDLSDPAAIAAAATRAQRRATDPTASVWVGASAGTGKTKVLTERVLRLLLADVAPGRLLCLTFTKAAAAEMATRIADRLAQWTTMSDQELLAQLDGLLGRVPNETELTGARQLFARVLDVPGGLKIQTIHGFCQSLLARFPLEAGVAPTFRLLDDQGAAGLQREARLAVLGGQTAGLDAADLAGWLDRVTGTVNEDGFAQLIADMIRERGRFAALIQQAGSVTGLIRRLADRLGCAPDASVAAVLASGFAAPDSARDAAMRSAATALARGKTTDQRRAAGLLRVLAATDRAAAWPLYRDQFLTLTDGGPIKALITKDCAAAAPDCAAWLRDEQERVQELAARIATARLAELSTSLIRLSAAILERYAARKAGAVQLDFDDLILIARALLADDGGCSWVMYKLDGGLDHILIDEAQDTNPDQWAVIEALAREFFTGTARDVPAGSRAPPRSLFVVGDAKQSIFSFQRADVAAFAAMERHFAGQVADARQRWEPVNLAVSFRSAAPVLAAVDAVFARPEAADGVPGPISHQVSRLGAAGLVELWPLALAEPPPAAAPWAPPLPRLMSVESASRSRGGPEDAAEIRQPAAPIRVAQLVAAKIRQLVREESLPARNRRIRPGDILVLVRRRGPFAGELVKACKRLGLPIAGLDRMLLPEQPAVQDLLALARFLLLPEDDLSLAETLRGPLVGLPEDTLYHLAWQRPATLWRAMRASSDPAVIAATAWLAGLRRQADLIPPYELFAGVLATGGRRRLVERLSEEAGDPLDEFLNLALRYETETTPSLQGFLHWVEAGAIEIKRASDNAGRDEIRLMTVHGSKGLQAPVVFLPDCGQVPKASDRLFWFPEAGPLWSPSVRDDDATATAARDLARTAAGREYRRLLYVALTRAEDRLYATGWGRSDAEAGSWYHLIRDGLAGIAEPVAFDFADLGQPGWQGDGLRLAGPAPLATIAPAAALAAAPIAAAPAPPPDPTLPDFIGPAPEEPTPSRPLSPSRPSETPGLRSPLLAAGDALGFRRGRLIHRLLQTLPELTPDARPDAGRRFLAHACHDLTAAELQAILAETLAVLDDPAFSEVFGPFSRAEQPVTGQVGSVVVAGQIDRLAILPDRVLIVDFKTNRPPPTVLAAVPAGYLGQLALYRHLIGRIYPDRPVEAALLWTDLPALMPIPGDFLDQALATRLASGLAGPRPIAGLQADGTQPT